MTVYHFITRPIIAIQGTSTYAVPKHQTKGYGYARIPNVLEMRSRQRSKIRFPDKTNVDLIYRRLRSVLPELEFFLIRHLRSIDQAGSFAHERNLSP